MIYLYYVRTPITTMLKLMLGRKCIKTLLYVHMYSQSFFLSTVAVMLSLPATNPVKIVEEA